MDDEFDGLWASLTDPIKAKAKERSLELARLDGRDQATSHDIVDSIREFVSYRPSVGPASLPTKEPGWWNKNVTGFIGITAALTIVFGVLGLLGTLRDLPKEFAQVTGSFLEIAKIFAGALVGGAAGAAASSSRK